MLGQVAVEDVRQVREEVAARGHCIWRDEGRAVWVSSIIQRGERGGGAGPRNQSGRKPNHVGYAQFRGVDQNGDRAAARDR